MKHLNRLCVSQRIGCGRDYTEVYKLLAQSASKNVQDVSGLQYNTLAIVIKLIVPSTAKLIVRKKSFGVPKVRELKSLKHYRTHGEELVQDVISNFGAFALMLSDNWLKHTDQLFLDFAREHFTTRICLADFLQATVVF